MRGHTSNAQGLFLALNSSGAEVPPSPGGAQGIYEMPGIEPGLAHARQASTSFFMFPKNLLKIQILIETNKVSLLKEILLNKNCKCNPEELTSA